MCCKPMFAFSLGCYKRGRETGTEPPTQTFFSSWRAIFYGDGRTFCNDEKKNIKK